MTFKEMVALRDARIQQLLDEKKAADEALQRQARESARNQILRKEQSDIGNDEFLFLLIKND